MLSVQREEEKRRQQKRQQELTGLARQHYLRTLLSHRGLAPWKRLIQLRRDNVQVNHLFIAAVSPQLTLRSPGRPPDPRPLWAPQRRTFNANTKSTISQKNPHPPRPVSMRLKEHVIYIYFIWCFHFPPAGREPSQTPPPETVHSGVVASRRGVCVRQRGACRPALPTLSASEELQLLENSVYSLPHRNCHSSH